MSFISGCGSTNVDLLYEGMPRIPDVGEEIYSKDFKVRLGGGLPATLINLSRLGIETKIATELGCDMFSKFAENEYKKLGIKAVNLYNGDNIPVNITSAVILENDRSFISYGKGGITCNNSTSDAIYNMASGSKVILIQPDGFIDVYKKLKKEGAVFILDTGWEDGLSIDKYRDFLELADYYTPNRKEALKITDTKSVEEAAKILNGFFNDTIIKLDKDGCLYYDGNEFTYIKGIDEYNNVDSTGAGDAFLAGFAYGIYHEYSIKDAILFGNITGGKAVTDVGALSAYHNEKELIEQYKKYR